MSLDSMDPASNVLTMDRPYPSPGDAVSEAPDGSRIRTGEVDSRGCAG